MKFTAGKIITNFLFLLVLSAFVFGKGIPAGANLLPPETIFLVEAGNFSELNTQFQKTNMYKLYSDPAMAAFIGDVKARINEKTKEVQNDIIKAILDTKALPQGRVILGLVLNEKARDSNEPMAVLIAEWGENVGVIKEAVSKTVQKALDEGCRQQSEDFRGQQIKTIISTETERLGYGFSSSLSYTFMDDCLLASEDPELVKLAITNIGGSGRENFSADPDYSSSLKVTGPYHDIDVYFNTKQLIKASLKDDTSGKIKTTLTNLGVDNVAGIAFSLGLNRAPGSSMNAKYFIKVNGTKRGICKIFDVEQAPVKAAKFIPAKAYSNSFINLNMKAAFAEITNILNSFNPMYASMMYMPLIPQGPNGEPGVQLQADIIQHLGSGITMAQSINKPFGTTSSPTETLVGIGVSNRNALEKSMSNLHGKMLSGGDPDSKREFLGYTIYMVNVGNLFPFLGGGMTPMQAPLEAGTQPQMPKLAFTITDTHMIFGSEAGVENAVRTLADNKTDSLDTAKWFNHAKNEMPSVVGMAGMEDSSVSMELLWWMMKEASKASAGQSMEMNPFMMVSKDLDLNFGLLPEYEAVRKYFGLWVSYAVSKPDGFFFEAKDIGAGN